MPTSTWSVVMYAADGVVAAAGAFLERLLERARDEAGVAELLEVAGEERGDELALAEDAGQPAVAVDHRQRGKATVENGAHGVLDAVVAAQRRCLADERVRDAPRSHHRYLSAM